MPGERQAFNGDVSGSISQRFACRRAFDRRLWKCYDADVNAVVPRRADKSAVADVTTGQSTLSTAAAAVTSGGVA